MVEAPVKQPARPQHHTSLPLDYTIRDIHKVIPAHCFEPNSLLSLGYVLRDFFFAFTLAAIAIYGIPHLPNPYVRLAAWTTYSFCQGLVFTGLWELAHECGHGALYKEKWKNDATGMVVHSFLLVPYHSWRLTHSTHHRSTNHMDRDIAFVPDTEEDWVTKRKSGGWHIKFWELVEDMPIAVLIELVAHQLVAFPTYLLINNFALPRMAIIPWWKRSHFYFGGDGPNFLPASRRDIINSTLGIAASVGLIYAATHIFGGWNVMKVYGFPYLWTNHWILTITFLQHTDFSVPYYGSASWTFLKGAAATIDRDFGFIGTFIFHGALETHVLHHHASRIPFYHAAEASEAIKPVMGANYRRDFETPYLWAFWKNRKACRFVNEVDQGSKVYFFPKLE